MITASECHRAASSVQSGILHSGRQLHKSVHYLRVRWPTSGVAVLSMPTPAAAASAATERFLLVFVVDTKLTAAISLTNAEATSDI